MKRLHKEEKCPLCGGARAVGKTTYSADLGYTVIVVRNVPAMICEQCGEEWIADDVAGRLEEITEEARRKKHQVEVLAF